MRTIEDVLDEMIGANYMITQSQIQEIREIHAAEHVPDTNDGDMISRQTATNGLYRLSLGETDAIRLYYRMHDYLKKLPPAPERTGHWIPDDMTGIIKCDRCENDAPINTATAEQYKSKYCPDCGAHMIEEVDE